MKRQRGPLPVSHHNGSMERNPHDLREEFERKLASDTNSFLRPQSKSKDIIGAGSGEGGRDCAFSWMVEPAALDCNRKPRPVLSGTNSYFTFFRNGRDRKIK